MFLIPATSLAWRLFCAFCWALLAVACALVLDLAIVGLFVEVPGERFPAPETASAQTREACPCDLCVREAR